MSNELLSTNLRMWEPPPCTSCWDMDTRVERICRCDEVAVFLVPAVNLEIQVLRLQGNPSRLQTCCNLKVENQDTRNGDRSTKFKIGEILMKLFTINYMKGKKKFVISTEIIHSRSFQKIFKSQFVYGNPLCYRQPT